MSLKDNIEDIDFDIREIDILMKVYSKWIDIQEKPAIGELTILGSVLHSFYNGLEKIFISILKIKGKPIHSGKNWHKELIDELFKTSEFEKLIFPLPIKDIFEEYQHFRHFSDILILSYYNGIK